MTYQHRPLFRLGKDTTPYRKLTSEGVKVEKLGDKDVLTVSREAMRLLAEQAMTDINHLLRPGHLAQLRKILDDPEATGNDKFVAFDLLKNANIAAGGVLPMCQDTGTAIVMGKKGRLVLTDGTDEDALADGIRDALYRQAFGPVRWVETIQALKARGHSHIIECGPGKVLSGMVKRIDAEMTGAALYDPATLSEVKGLLA